MTTPHLARRMYPWIGLLSRLVLAGVFLIAGLLKVREPITMEVSVAAYDLLPESLVTPVALLVPLIEIILGGFLLLGIKTRWMGVGSALLMMAFLVGIAQAWARGLTIDCGCFGTGGVDPSVTGWTYATEMLRDAAFLAMAVWLIRWPRTPGALEPGSRYPLRASSRS